MNVRTLVGVIVSIIGLILMLLGGLNFNNLFFVQRMYTKLDLPIYNQSVILPVLLGFLILLDGSLILGLKRIFSLSLHLLGNFVWLYALNLLYKNLAVPVDEISAYQQIFYLVFLAIFFFVIGVVINDIPRKPKPTQQT